jgi:hypothetical protein
VEKSEEIQITAIGEVQSLETSMGYSIKTDYLFVPHATREILE